MLKSIIIAAIIAITIIIWVASGQFNNSEDSSNIIEGNPKISKSTKEPFLVETKIYRSSLRKSEIVLRGKTDSARKIDIKAETDGKIEKIFIKKGSSVKKGQILFKINMKDRNAKLKEAISLVEQRKLEYDVAVKLKSKGHRSATKVASAAAKLESSISRQKAIDLDIKNTIIKAPFAGYIDRKFVELGDVISRNVKVAHLVDKDPFLVIGQVSETDISKIKVGDKARAKLINGNIINGFIRYISLTAESKTKTFRVEIEVPNKDNQLRAGLTAEIFIEISKQQAHFPSPAVLTLSDSGLLGVRIVNDKNKVEFMNIKIVEDTEKGVWVTGLPNEVNIITVGQEFVSNNEIVRTKLSDKNE
ncbi:MAG: Macrolide export protein MacA [Alphaproteobacteria bacterium MarineAlpha2_Bin1]|nr:MAG: Macrolide export protein MacA [Alphaproteobacteria bacterium MarineAlpha2_Bin1]